MRTVTTTKFIKLADLANEFIAGARIAGAPEYLIELASNALASGKCDTTIHYNGDCSVGYNWTLTVNENTCYCREASVSVHRKDGEIKVWTEQKFRVVADDDEELGSFETKTYTDESEKQNPEPEEEA